jgi:hypothetical protein
MIKIVSIDGYKIRVDKIAGISSIVDFPDYYQFEILCGGNLKIKRKTLKEIEEIKKEIEKVWYSYINMSSSIKEIKIS